MLDHLTPEQARAVTHLHGPMLVLAGAGAGKTRVLCHRLAWLIDQGNDPAQVLALTFTRQAAEELRGRAEDLLGTSHETLRVQTFHAWAQELARRHGVEHGLVPAVRQIDTEHRKLLLLDRLNELDLRLTTGRSDEIQVVDGLTSRIDRCRDELVDPQDYLEWATAAVASASDRKSELVYRRELEFANAFVAHDRWLAEEGVEDFGMSLVRALELIRRHVDRRDAIREESLHLLVDEFQDTNHAQSEILHTVANPAGSLVVVGDDDQGIYRFRGASTKNIADFRGRYPDAPEVRLERNYRSSQVILDAAWAVVSRVPDRVDKRLRAEASGDAPTPQVWSAPDPDGQARAVADAILHNAEHGMPYEEQAVLMRAVRTEAAPIVAELERSGIPYQVRGGLGLMDRREVRQAIAWMRALADPADGQAHLRISADPRFQAPWDRVSDVVHAANGQALREALCAALNDAEARALPDLLDRLGRIAATDPPDQVLGAILDLTGLRADAIAAGGAQGAARLAGLAGLQRVVDGLLQVTPTADLGHIARTLWALAGVGYRGEGANPPERRGVQVMTVHQSKGLEFDAVYVIGLTDRQWPTRDWGRTDIPDALLSEALPNDPDANVNEARRLAYVAMTRARRILVLSFPQVSVQGFNQRISRFIDDVLAEVPHIDIVEVGAPPHHVLLDDVAHARQALEDATLAAARAQAEGDDPSTATNDAHDAVSALISAQAAAFDPGRPTAIPAPAAPPQGPGLSLSVTALARYWRCPLQFKYAHIDHIPPRKDDATRGVGTATHLALQQGIPEDGPPRSADEIVALLQREMEHIQVADTAAGRHALARAKEAFPALVNRTITSGIRVERVEVPFTLMMGEHRIRGRIDRIDALPGGGHGLVDYKTGNQPVGSNEEGRTVMRIYMAGAAHGLGLDPRSAVLEYVLEGTKTVDAPSPGEMAEAHEITAATLDNISHERFDPTPGWVCRSCDYRLLCPAQDR